MKAHEFLSACLFIVDTIGSPTFDRLGDDAKETGRVWDNDEIKIERQPGLMVVSRILDESSGDGFAFMTVGSISVVKYSKLRPEDLVQLERTVEKAFERARQHHAAIGSLPAAKT